MTIANNRFPKSLRLHLKRDIDELFNAGTSIKANPVIAVYQIAENEIGGIKMAVSVPKKRVKLASDRNVIKRRIREAYRLNNQSARSYFSSAGLLVKIIFIYSGNVSPDYATLESKIILILQRLVKENEVDTD